MSPRCYLKVTPSHWLLVVGLVLMLSGCSSSPKQSVYEGAAPSKPLEFPPDLIVPGTDAAAGTVSITASYEGYATAAAAGEGIAPELASGIALARDGSQRWLVVDLPIERVWLAARAFLTDNGFAVSIEEAQLGILETDWLENRSDVPSNWFSRLFDNVDASGLKDRFRMRLERGDDGKTLVFVTHRGLREVVSGEESEQVNAEGWAWRTPDPLLELEMLQRFAVQLGMTAQAAVAAIPVQEPKAQAVIETRDGRPVLIINEGFARSWRRVQLALDRLGFLVQDRDRSAGHYYIKLSETFLEQEQSWLSRLFGGSGVPVDKVFMISLSEQANQTELVIRGESGVALDEEMATRLLGEFERLLR